MADDIAITAGSGTTVATDDVAGKHYQRVKISDGTADSANHLIIDANGGANVSGKAADDAAAAGNPVPVGGIASPTNTTVDADDVGYFGMTTYRAQYVQLMKSDGTLVDPATYAQDNASATGHSVVPAGAVYSSSKAQDAGSTGDYSWLKTNSVGDLHVDGGQAVDVYVSPTVAVTTYTSGDVLGGIMTFAGMARATGAGGTITGIQCIIEDDATGGWAANAIEVWIFNSSPANGTYTDDTAFALHADDRGDLIDVVKLDTFFGPHTSSVLKASNLNITYQCDATSLFLIARQTTALTPDQTDAVTFRVSAILD